MKRLVLMRLCCPIYDNTYTTITRNINFIQKRGQLIDYYNALGHIQYPTFIVELIN